MSNAVDRPLSMSEQFQKNVRDAILEKGVENLLPPQMLDELVNKAADDLFFKQKDVRDQYGRATGATKPSWFQEIVGEQMKPIVVAYTQEYLKQHPEILVEAVNKHLSDGLPEMILDYLQRQTQMDFHNMAVSMVKKITGRDDVGSMGIGYFR